MTTLYHTLLTLHILSFIVFIGATFIDFVLFRQFSNLFRIDFSKAKTVWEVKSKLRPLIRLAGLFAFVAGVSLVATSQGVFSGQAWLRVKVPLVLLAIITSIIFARKQQKRIGDLIQVKTSLSESDLTNHNGTFTLFYCIQFLLFLTIVVLSAFKFN